MRLVGNPSELEVAEVGFVDPILAVRVHAEIATSGILIMTNSDGVHCRRTRMHKVPDPAWM